MSSWAALKRSFSAYCNANFLSYAAFKLSCSFYWSISAFSARRSAAASRFTVLAAALLRLSARESARFAAAAARRSSSFYCVAYLCISRRYLGKVLSRPLLMVHLLKSSLLYLASSSFFSISSIVESFGSYKAEVYDQRLLTLYGRGDTQATSATFTSII